MSKPSRNRNRSGAMRHLHKDVDAIHENVQDMKQGERNTKLTREQRLGIVRGKVDVTWRKKS